MSSATSLTRAASERMKYSGRQGEKVMGIAKISRAVVLAACVAALGIAGCADEKTTTTTTSTGGAPATSSSTSHASKTEVSKTAAPNPAPTQQSTSDHEKASQP